MESIRKCPFCGHDFCGLALELRECPACGKVLLRWDDRVEKVLTFVWQSTLAVSLMLSLLIFAIGMLHHFFLWPPFLHLREGEANVSVVSPTVVQLLVQGMWVCLISVAVHSIVSTFQTGFRQKRLGNLEAYLEVPLWFLGRVFLGLVPLVAAWFSILSMPFDRLVVTPSHFEVVHQTGLWPGPDRTKIAFADIRSMRVHIHGPRAWIHYTPLDSAFGVAANCDPYLMKFGYQVIVEHAIEKGIKVEVD